VSGGRVWFAFEVAPGRTRDVDLTGHFRDLAKACRRPDGTVDVEEFERWVDVFAEHSHEAGSA
jgi:hypothetical protein